MTAARVRREGVGSPEPFGRVDQVHTKPALGGGNRRAEQDCPEGRSERPAMGHGQPRAVPLRMSLIRFGREDDERSAPYAVPSAGGLSLGGASSAFFDSKNCFRSPNVRSGSLPVCMAFEIALGGVLGPLAT